MGGLFTPRGAADTLTRTTAILAFLFFLTCIGLNLLALHGRNETVDSGIGAPGAGPESVQAGAGARAAAHWAVGPEAAVARGFSRLTRVCAGIARRA